MAKNEYIKSPMNYTGGKYKLLPQIMPLMVCAKPKRFIDLFCGGANVAVNFHSDKVIASDNNEKVIEIYNCFKNLSIDDILAHINKRITQYSLTKTNAEGFNQLRDYYNNSTEKYPLDLFVLICYSFNHQIRFNRNGEYNMPFGKDRSEFNKSIEKNLIAFREAIENITFVTKDFRELKIEKLMCDDLVYCDPPYLITCATYNEKDGWNAECEHKLLEMLDNINSVGSKFALSNVLSNKGKENDILIKWLEERPQYDVIHLEQSYANCNYHTKDKTSKPDEVLVRNFS